MATILDGSIAAASIRVQIAEEVKAFVSKGHRAPGLVAILVGEDGASQTYVGAKKTACDEVGFAGDVRRFSADITEEALLKEIEKRDKVKFTKEEQSECDFIFDFKQRSREDVYDLLLSTDKDVLRKKQTCGLLYRFSVSLREFTCKTPAFNSHRTS
jgi:hypothetical protein